MIRFRIAGVPVQIHLSHLLISGVVAWSLLGWKQASTAWPREILSQGDHPRYHFTAITVWLTWTLIVSGSVFIHAISQALTARAFGAAPQLHLVGLGGRAVHEERPRLEWWQEISVRLSGAGAGMLLAVCAGMLVWLGGGRLPDALRYFGTGIFYGNLTWTFLNLLPFTGLGGGIILTALLTRVFGRPGFLMAQVAALAFSVLVMALAVVTQQLLLAVLVGFMALRSFGNIGAYQRGLLPEGFAAHPLAAVVERAEALYRDRKLPEAQRVARGVLENAEAPPLLRSRAHVLLGWIALKEGDGRRGLDHFSQVQGLEVPLHALAAGFSLVGDEARAIPLWAQAAQGTPDPVILHEFAGALIRAGREAEARALPGVELPRAYAAAERVHYVRREFEAAARAAEAAFREAPLPGFAYTAACAWALAGKAEDAMRLLRDAAARGFHDATEARTDPDLRSLRGTAAFEAWLTQLSPPEGEAASPSV